MSTRFGLADQDVFHSLWHVAVYPEASFTSERSGAGMPQSLLLDKVPREITGHGLPPLKSLLEWKLSAENVLHPIKVNIKHKKGFLYLFEVDGASCWRRRGKGACEWAEAMCGQVCRLFSLHIFYFSLPEILPKKMRIKKKINIGGSSMWHSLEYQQSRNRNYQNHRKQL